MPDSVLLEVARQIPVAVILFATILLFLNNLQKRDDARMIHDKEMEALRIAAAKERETDRRTHESDVMNMWIVQFKNITEKQDQTSRMIADELKQNAKTIADALAVHEENSKERYEKMGITQDLLDISRDALARRK